MKLARERIVHALVRSSPPELDAPWAEQPPYARADYESAADCVIDEIHELLHPLAPSSDGGEREALAKWLHSRYGTTDDAWGADVEDRVDWLADASVVLEDVLGRASSPPPSDGGDQTGYDAPCAARAREVLTAKLTDVLGYEASSLAESAVETLVEEELLVALWPSDGEGDDGHEGFQLGFCGTTDKAGVVLRYDLQVWHDGASHAFRLAPGSLPGLQQLVNDPVMQVEPDGEVDGEVEPLHWTATHRGLLSDRQRDEVRAAPASPGGEGATEARADSAPESTDSPSQQGSEPEQVAGEGQDAPAREVAVRWSAIGWYDDEGRDRADCLAMDDDPEPQSFEEAIALIRCARSIPISDQHDHYAVLRTTVTEWVDVPASEGATDGDS